MKKKRKETQFSFFFCVVKPKEMYAHPNFLFEPDAFGEREFVPFYFKIYCFIFHFLGVFDRLEIKGHTADSSVSRT